MNLITLIIFGAGLLTGWSGHRNKESVKKWIQKKLRKANEKAKQL